MDLCNVLYFCRKQNAMFKRDALNWLNEWKDRENRKPLVIRGARQVGKTSLVKEFGKQFDTFLSFNLEMTEDLALFQKEIPVRELYDTLLIVRHRTKRTGTTLLFIDEIQNSLTAIKMLRYFYEEFPERLVPYDFEAYKANPAVFEMVTTNCLTGLPNYLSERNDYRRLVRIAKASSSLPYVCPVVIVDRMPMLDGGIVDSIPVERAIGQGCGLCVTVLTRNRGYRKPKRDIHLPRFIYRRFPHLREVLSRRCECYNRQLELVERLEDEGRIIVVRPQEKVAVDRLEENTAKLQALYEEGYACAQQVLGALDLSALKWTE